MGHSKWVANKGGGEGLISPWVNKLEVSKLNLALSFTCLILMGHSKWVA